MQRRQSPAETHNAAAATRAIIANCFILHRKSLGTNRSWVNCFVLFGASSTVKCGTRISYLYPSSPPPSLIMGERQCWSKDRSDPRCHSSPLPQQLLAHHPSYKKNTLISYQLQSGNNGDRDYRKLYTVVAPTIINYALLNEKDPVIEYIIMHSQLD